MFKIINKIALSSVFIISFGMYAWGRDNTTTPTIPSESTITLDSSSKNENTFQYRDGLYVGTETDAYYGKIKTAVSISQGKINDVTFITYPNAQQNSIRLNQDAIPRLKSEVIAKQSGEVDSITGASLTSVAFLESISSGLKQAKI